jgi:hypothetical protein
VLLRLQEKQHRSGLPRRMPCEKYSQVVDTLVPLESRTLHSNQLVKEENEKAISNNFLDKTFLKDKKRKRFPSSFLNDFD